jgi:Hydrazine synthase alpha subunit middle domain/WD40-like Beta Propeller Repeat
MSNTMTRYAPILVAGGLLAGCNGSAPNDLLGGEQTTQALVFVKAVAEESLNRTRSESNLYILSPISPDGEVRPLTAFTSASIYDPCVSFDGKKVLFSMAPEPGQPRNIWEINTNGSGLRKITGRDARGRDGDDFDPLYLPDGRIVFTSNRPGYLDEYNRSPAEVLHVCNADGSAIEQISYNMSDDFDPFLLPDGTIAYTRWDHHGTMNRFPLFSTRPDGSGTFHLFGPHNLNFFHTATVPDGRLIAVISNEVNGDAGRLALCRLEGTHGDPLQPGQMATLTPDIDLRPPYTRGAFKYPNWIGENRFVISYSLPYGSDQPGMEEEGADFGLYTFEVIPGGPDGETISNLTFLYNDPLTQEYDAQLVAPHDRPPVVPTQIDPSQSTGVFAVTSIYRRQTGDGQERPPVGSVSQVMVIEAIPTFPGDGMGISTTEFERKRILGVAPVEADGSFHIRVPANTPISFNVLDDMGRSFVTKRNWIYARPGESFTKCNGCHADRGQPGSDQTLALARAATDLETPVGLREVINFRDVLEPIVASKCMPCHQPTFQTVYRDSVAVIDTIAAPAMLDLRMDALRDTMQNVDFPRAYLSLAGGQAVNFVDTGVTVPGFSRRSRLIDWVLGVGSRAGQPAHPEGGQALTAEEKRKFTVWVDLGAQYR